VTCPSCGAANPPEARFCMQCGTALSLRCPACGTELPAGARFCFACGHQLARKAERMQPGDRIVVYATGKQAFAFTATITSPYFEDHSSIWTRACFQCARLIWEN